MQSIMNSQRRLRCCLLGHAPKLGTGQIYNNVTKIQHISVSVGLIPAHTGNTSLHPHRKGQSTAHPRTYGECEQWEQLGMYFVGSPPRIQGIRNMAIRRITNLRLTPPAYGENAPKSLARRAINGSSPRIRENRFTLFLSHLMHGSSPHIRENWLFALFCRMRYGSSPHIRENTC